MGMEGKRIDWRLENRIGIHIGGIKESEGRKGRRDSIKEKGYLVSR